jgi:uncharacterized protein YcnI
MARVKIRTLIAVSAALAAGMLLPVASMAHVDIAPGEAPAGRSLDLSFTVGHDCEGAATTGLDVKVPPGVRDYSAKPVAGWRASTGAARMKWKGGPQPEGVELSLPFRATVYGERGEQIPFKVIQICEGGAETAWIQTGGGQAEGDDPAPVLTLTSSKAAPFLPPAGNEPVASEGEGTTSGASGDQQVATEGNIKADEQQDSDGVGIGQLVGLILIVASITAFVIIRRGKRKTG